MLLHKREMMVIPSSPHVALHSRISTQSDQYDVSKLSQSKSSSCVVMRTLCCRFGELFSWDVSSGSSRLVVARVVVVTLVVNASIVAAVVGEFVVEASLVVVVCGSVKYSSSKSRYSDKSPEQQTLDLFSAF